MQTVKIRNPRLDTLPGYLLSELSALGKLKPLSFGKMKGFRIQYKVNNQGARDKVLSVLSVHGIKVTAFTEQVTETSGHLNIHEIEVFQGSVVGARYLEGDIDLTC